MLKGGRAFKYLQWKSEVEVKLMEFLEMAKLPDFIEVKILINFISTWKPLVLFARN